MRQPVESIWMDGGFTNHKWYPPSSRGSAFKRNCLCEVCVLLLEWGARIRETPDGPIPYSLILYDDGTVAALDPGERFLFEITKDGDARVANEVKHLFPTEVYQAAVLLGFSRT